MTLMKFRGYSASKTVRFTCTNCGKAGRTKTIKHECTVNPFNRNENGEIRTPDEVKAQSRELVKRDMERFLREPVCAACEGHMTYGERRSLRARREGVVE